MAKAITIPRLGWSMEEGTFVEWLKKSGDVITPGTPLFALEGEKALQEIEAVDGGVLHIPENGPAPGEVVPVGGCVAFLLEEHESPPTYVKPQVTAPTKKVVDEQKPLSASVPPVLPPAFDREDSIAAAPSVRRLARELGVDLRSLGLAGGISVNDVRRAAAGQRRPAPMPRSDGPVPVRNSSPSLPRISPRAARTAEQQGVDWSRIAGSGRSGRIREQDILAALQNGPSCRAASPLPSVPGQLKPGSPLRKAIAQRMQASAQQTVPVTLTTKFNAANLVALRERLKSESPAIVPSYNDIIVHRVASLLKNEPALNACWLDGGIYFYDVVNIAVAVDTEAGLLAPVVEQADGLSLADLVSKTKDLSQSARSGRLTQPQLTGGTFTVTNLGMFGIDGFTPVINLPQSAILGIGRIVDEPVVVENQVVPGKTLILSLTFDHRVIDGAPAARWLQSLADTLISL